MAVMWRLRLAHSCGGTLVTSPPSTLHPAHILFINWINQLLIRTIIPCRHTDQGFIIMLQTKAIRRFVIRDKAPTRAFSWLKVATTASTFKTLNGR